MQKCALRNFAKFTGKHLCQILFLNKVAGLWDRCFLVNFAKFLRTPFLQNSFGQLLLELKVKWRTHCALAVACNDKSDANPNNIIITDRDKKLYVHFVTLSVEDNQILSKLLSKKFER